MGNQLREIKVIAASCLLALSIEAHAEPMTCKLMEVLATNTAQQAYDKSRNHIELIEKKGIFDTWMLITAQLFQSYKKPEDAEFVAVAKIVGLAMIDIKADIVEKTAPEEYPNFFGRMIFRTCDDVEKKGWRK